MQSLRNLGIATAVLLAASIVVMVLTNASRAQQNDILTNQSTNMKTFKKPAQEQLQKALSPEQFAVTQQCGTEPPFRNAYWDNHKPGIYVDVVSGEPLFSSLDKYDSGTGWPSFTQPVDAANVATEEDRSVGMRRTEAMCANCGAHLGHVFDDGPAPTGTASASTAAIAEPSRIVAATASMSSDSERSSPSRGDIDRTSSHAAFGPIPGASGAWNSTA
jgi:methionine-R-sulfoxide reductase